MYRVYIADTLPPEGLQILEQAENITLDNRPSLSGSELAQALADCDGLVVRSATQVTAELLELAPKLRIIVRAGAGVDTINVAAATRKGIIVMNTPDGNTISTAEHTLAVLFALCRQIPAADASMRAGQWERKKFVGRQLAGKTLGIVGLGRIGRAIAQRALAMEMRVLGYDPFLASDRAAELGLETVTKLEELLPQADVLTVHVPLTEDTRGLIDAKALALLPAGALVVNCARGGIIVESALLEALRSGHLGGVGLDVYEVEPPKAVSPFAEFPNVLLTPHLGASTAEAQLNVAIDAAKQLREYFNTGKIQHAVNLTPLLPAEMAEIRRYLDLAYRLGRLLRQYVGRTNIRRASIEFRGDCNRAHTKLITTAFAIGLLEGVTTEGVNMVNALLFAQERGLHITERLCSEPGDFQTLLHTEIYTEEGTNQPLIAAATTRGNQYNRLVRLGPYRFDSFLDGTMLTFEHQDQPGVIGLVGTVLGKYQVNIAQMTVGRHGPEPVPNGKAMGLMAVDQEPPAAALEELRQSGRLDTLRVIKLLPMGQLPDCFG